MNRWIAIGVIGCACASFATAQLQKHMTPDEEKAARAQAVAANSVISLDVVVHTKNGAVVPEFKQDQLTVLDDRHPVALTSFKAMHTGDEPERAVLVYDPDSLPPDDVGGVKEKLLLFLHQPGPLPIPTAIALAGGQGLRISAYTRDPKQLATAFTAGSAPASHGARSEAGAGGGHGHGGSPSQRALVAIERLMADSEGFHGRTAVVWLTQGWPLEFGPEMQLNDTQRMALLHEAEAFDTMLRQSRMTLYMLDPIENDKFDPSTMSYLGFLKGPKSMSEGAPAFLGMQILAIHSGGWVQVSSDILHAMNEVYGDLSTYYRVTFAAAPATKPDTLHLIEYKTPSKQMIPRGIDVYWANPAPGK